MYKRRGRIKFLPRGASKYTPPPPSPEQCLLARKWGEGGGYIISLEWNPSSDVSSNALSEANSDVKLIWKVMVVVVAGGVHDKLGNRRSSVSRVLFHERERERELTEFCANLGESYEKLGEFALAHNL